MVPHGPNYSQPELRNTMQRYRRRSEVPAYVKQKFGLAIGAKTLANLAVTGGGPKFHRFGAQAVYGDDDVDEWVQRRLGAPRSSTSDEAYAA